MPAAASLVYTKSRRCTREPSSPLHYIGNCPAHSTMLLVALAAPDRFCYSTANHFSTSNARGNLSSRYKSC